MTLPGVVTPINVTQISEPQFDCPHASGWCHRHGSSAGCADAGPLYVQRQRHVHIERCDGGEHLFGRLRQRGGEQPADHHGDCWRLLNPDGRWVAVG
jgi:hypothetical protein